MTWLIAHQQELFIGVLTSAAVAIAGYFLHRWFGPRQQPTGAALTAQGARVSDSPVASGSGITQTIGDTHHHHYPSAVVPPTPVANPAVVPFIYVEPLPNVGYIGADVISLQINTLGALVENGSLQNAIAIRFSNDARQDAQNLSARIKAVLIYRIAGNEIDDVAGAWIGEGEVAEFSPDSRRHKLVVGMVSRGGFNIVTKEKLARYRSDYYIPQYKMLQNFQSGTVLVQLTDFTRGRLLYEGEFEIGMNPLRISLLKSLDT